MMRIVRYYPRAAVGDGGMTGAVRQWSRGMARAGAEMVIAFDGGYAPQDELVEWVKVQHRGSGLLRVPVGLDAVLRRADLLVLHSGWTMHNVRAASVARSLGVPYVLEPRGAYDPHIVARRAARKRVWWTALERELVQRARAVHVFFEQERGHLQALGYRGPVVVAPNGARHPDGTRWDGGTGDYVLWLGRFDPEHKGLDLLLMALAAVPAGQRPRLRIHGPDWRGRKRRVQRLVADLRLQDWAAVGEPVHGRAKRELLVGASGFVYPSRWDACPNSVLEAVALGVPTLTTPYPLGRYLGSAGGALVAEATPRRLGEGLRALSSGEAAPVGRRGSEVVAEELTWDRVARSWLGQVEALL